MSLCDVAYCLAAWSDVPFSGVYVLEAVCAGVSSRVSIWESIVQGLSVQGVCVEAVSVGSTHPTGMLVTKEINWTQRKY